MLAFEKTQFAQSSPETIDERFRWRPDALTNKQWHQHKRSLQQYLREKGYEPTVREAELLLHQLRSKKRQSAKEETR